MRIRMKFTKCDQVQFVGHLDTVRLFQRAIKVANIPIAYSQGFNPHSLVYFALPLSVGVSSMSEYMDIVTQCDVDIEDVAKTLNDVLPRGVRIVEAFQVETTTPTLMSLVTEADYEITFPKEKLTDEVVKQINDRLESEELVTLKKGKKNTREVDIKPMIKKYAWGQGAEKNILNVRIAAGSTENLSPDLLIKVLSDDCFETYEYSLCRKAFYTETEEGTVSLSQYGRIV
ncbi:MAG: TIGR03936 family radical SAM-associated protein [Cellulosilyticaceae bacterium]